MAENAQDTLRITNQFRKKGGMVYDLKGDGLRLTLVVSPRSTTLDPDDWHVEASLFGQGDDARVDRWGVTRTAALQAVGVEWGRLTLPRFDWEAVRIALAAVRAV